MHPQPKPREGVLRLVVYDEHSASELRQRILEAFPDAEPPPIEELLRGGPDSPYVERAFGGKRWRECGDDVLCSGGGQCALIEFTPRGFAYYLPAYLISLVNSDAISEYNVNLEIVLNLEVHNDWSRMLTSALTKPQLDVTIDLLGVLVERGSIEWRDARGAIVYLVEQLLGRR